MTQTATPSSLTFEDISFREMPVTIGSKSYILREANGEASSRWRGEMMKGTRRTAEGEIIMGGTGDTEALLVSLCLFEKTDKGEKSVPLHVIKSWPYRVQKVLFDQVKEISELEDQETKEALVEKRDKLDQAIRKLDSGEGDPKN